ncbi:BQ2448_4701 [Microbotryum intermedium]|uniref:BQ2448_4701 protein n=1 Tax=Microbotryum intermedium TaxID=269621 RepID=A0A238FFJ7_9BASI|nr:BQ2448_4701 [Microbotryum intermedium]
MPRVPRQRRAAVDGSHDDLNLRLATPPPHHGDGDGPGSGHRPAAAARVEIDHHFHRLVYDAVRSIPEGRLTSFVSTQVSSYGRIASLIGHPKHSRHVGAALKLLPPRLSTPHLPQQRNPTHNVPDEPQDPDAPLAAPEPNPDFVPWHRVVSSNGQIAARMNDVSVARQAEWLIAEGVQVDDIPDQPPRRTNRAPAARGGDAFEGWGFRSPNSGGKVKISLYAWP